MSQDEPKEGKIYELAYLFVPTLPEEESMAEHTALKELAASFGASAVAEEAPKLMELAYQMERDISNKKHKFTSGYFGWMKFELDPEKVAEFKDEVSRKDTIIRFMIIRTTKESTMAPKKPKTEGRVRGKKEDGTEPEAMNKEEVDKKIEEMAVAA